MKGLYRDARFGHFLEKKKKEKKRANFDGLRKSKILGLTGYLALSGNPLAVINCVR